jgi:hypothetical protein
MIPIWCTPEEGAARLHPKDSVGMPRDPGRSAAFIEALGGRDDWEELRLYGALPVVPSAVFDHPDVHCLSGFFGPFERALQASRATRTSWPVWTGPRLGRC